MPILEKKRRRDGTKQHNRITNFAAGTEKIAFIFITETDNGSLLPRPPSESVPAEVAPASDSMLFMASDRLRRRLVKHLLSIYCPSGYHEAASLGREHR